MVSGDPVSWLERGGSDPPVLLLHGWGASADTFATLLRLSRTPRRLLALDLPGFGQSPIGRGEWTTSKYAGLVRSFMAQCGGTSLLGHSYGGAVSIRVAAEAPAVIDRLLLCAASGVRFPLTSAATRRVRRYKRLRRLAGILPARARQAALEGLAQRFGSEDYRTAGPMRPTLVHAVQEDLRPLAERISVPTLIVWGESDPELPLDPYGTTLAGLVGPGELVTFSASGHFPFLDEPVRFAAVVDAFMDAGL